jgi:hypothetical protein
MKKNLLIIILLIIAGIFTFNYFSNREVNYKKDRINYQIDSESENPNFYLNYEISERKRLLHSGYEIYFKIENKSKHTTYKDFKVKINSIGNSGSLIKSEETILYESLKPNERKTFSYKTKGINKKYKIRIESIKPNVIQ